MQVSNYASQEIEITSVYFRKNKLRRSLELFPKSMVYEGRQYSFLDDGLKFMINSTDAPINLFDVSDGQRQYRLRQDEQNHWTLVNVRA